MVKKIREIISDQIKNLETTKGVKGYIGKKVYSKSGSLVGKVKEVVMADYVVLGVNVNSKLPLFIDRKFFASDSEDAIMLLIDPIFEVLGMQVFDKDGRRLGKVKSIVRTNNENKFVTLNVKKGIFNKSISIKAGDVEVSKKNIILNKSYEKKDE